MAKRYVSPIFQSNGSMDFPPVPSPPKRLIATPSPAYRFFVRIFSSTLSAFALKSNGSPGSHTEKIATFLPS